MHINEIRGFSGRVNLDRQFKGRGAKVVVALPKDGKRFWIVPTGGTSLNKDEAFVYDYDHHDVASQVEQVISVMGVVPEVHEV